MCLLFSTSMRMHDSTARITAKEDDTENIRIEVGVRQGNSLSTTLFNIALDKAIKQARLERKITQLKLNRICR